MVLLIIVLLIRDLIGNSDSITKISHSAGIFGPIIFILLISLGILFSPIPSVVLIITAGYMYAIWLGALYSYIGHLLDASEAFLLVRKLNLKTKNKKYKKYQKLINANKRILYFLYAFPLVPISITSILSASTKMKFKKFLKIILISFAPPILFFSFFGNRLSNQNFLELGLLVLVIIVGSIIIYRRIQKESEK